jgi:hypothetical protein
MGGYGASGLVGTGRQLRRTRGGSFLHVPSGPGPQTGGGVAKTARYNTEGPTPLSTTDPSSQNTGTISYPKAEGVAPNFDRPSPGSGGMTFPTLDKIGNVLATAGGAIAARKRKAADKEAKAKPADQQASAAPTGQPLPPPTGPAQPGPQPFAAPKASENLTYTTGNTPFTLGDDPFVGADTDELGRPLKNTGGGQPWGPPTGPPKHGPIFLGDDPFSGSDTAPPTSRTQRRPAGQQTPAPSAPPSSEQFAAPPSSRTQGRPSVVIDDYANQAEFPDTYDLGTPLSGEEELAIRRQDLAARRPDSGGRVAPGRPESSGRTLPNRPGGRRLAANPNSWFSGGASEFAGAQAAPEQAPAPTPETSGMTRREQVAASRPQSLGQTVASPFRPRSVMAQRGGQEQPESSTTVAPTPDTSGFYQGDQGQLFDAGPVAQQAPQPEATQQPAGQIPGQRQLPFNRPQGTGNVAPGRPAPTGRTMPNRPGGPRFAAQQAAQQRQAQVESAATSMEYPSAATPATPGNTGNTGMSPNGRYPANWNQMSRDEQFRWLKDNGREGEGWSWWRY